MAKRIKSVEQKLRHNCSTCQASYTLLETHLTKKDNQQCSTNCKKAWERIITKFCQEKVLGQELEQENSKDQEFNKNSGDINKYQHGSN